MVILKLDFKYAIGLRVNTPILKDVRKKTTINLLVKVKRDRRSRF